MKKLAIATITAIIALTSVCLTVLAAPSSWAQEAVEKIRVLDVVPNELFDDNKFQENVTLDEFTVTIVKILERHAEPKSNNSSTVNIEGSLDSDAILKGIQYGIEYTSNSQGLITREHAAVIITKVLSQLPIDLIQIQDKVFSDHNKISSWAVEAINTVCANGLMSSSDNQFNPQGNLTRDQLFVMASNLENFLQDKLIIPKVMETQPVSIPKVVETPPVKKAEETQWLSFNDFTINIGDTQKLVESKIGKPDRQGLSQFNFEWNIYNSDPTMLTMIGYIDDKVSGIYHMSKAFTSSNGNYGDIHKWQTSEILGRDNKLKFVDTEDGNKVYGVMFISDSVKWDSDEEAPTNFNDFAKNQLEVVNIFRNWNNIKPLMWDDSLASVAQAHSQDMIDKDYFSHTTPNGVTLSDRIKTNTRFQGGGENIAQEYFRSSLNEGFWLVNRWINSAGHRENILRTLFNYFGAGYAGNPDINNVDITQNFAK